jgi:hypothetical protein
VLWVFEVAVLSSKEGGEKTMLHRVLAVLVVTALMVAVLAFPALAKSPRAGAGLVIAECAQDAAGPGAAACRPAPGPP